MRMGLICYIYYLSSYDSYTQYAFALYLIDILVVMDMQSETAQNRPRQSTPSGNPLPTSNEVQSQTHIVCKLNILYIII